MWQSSIFASPSFSIRQDIDFDETLIGSGAGPLNVMNENRPKTKPRRVYTYSVAKIKGKFIKAYPFVTQCTLVYLLLDGRVSHSDCQLVAFMVENMSLFNGIRGY